jgi:HAE1 family hydrophobic/amphiphilic exporter-1
MPEDFVFRLIKPVVINNNIGRLLWGIGPKGGPPVQTGMDIAIFQNDKIQALYVFLD